jgi:4,5-dihydroxyphthalate decarboxylase
MTTATQTLKTAIGGYGHFAAIKDGSIAPDGVSLEHVEIAPIINAFRRMCRGLEFDVCEMAITTYLTAKAYGLPFTAIPVFPVRAFHHNAAVGNTKAGVSSPKDLEGKKAGVRAYTVTTGVWSRGILQNEYGVDLTKVNWILADEEHVEQFHADKPSYATYDLGAKLADMLVEGELQGGIGLGRFESPDIKPLVPQASAAAAEWYKKTNIYPINHMIVVKDELLDANPGLAASLFQAFKAAKEKWLASATDDDKKAAGHNIVEGDPFPYGIAANRPALEEIIKYARQQEILKKDVAVEDVFAKGSSSLS